MYNIMIIGKIPIIVRNVPNNVYTATTTSDIKLVKLCTALLYGRNKAIIDNIIMSKQVLKIMNGVYAVLNGVTIKTT